MFNPIKFQYLATKLASGELCLQFGAKTETINIPDTLLPSEIKIGDSFIIKLLPADIEKTGEYETMRKLLQELIN